MLAGLKVLTILNRNLITYHPPNYSGWISTGYAGGTKGTHHTEPEISSHTIRPTTLVGYPLVMLAAKGTHHPEPEISSHTIRPTTLVGYPLVTHNYSDWTSTGYAGWT